MKPRVLLADDHRIVAEGLRSLLSPNLSLLELLKTAERLLMHRKSFVQT